MTKRKRPAHIAAASAQAHTTTESRLRDSDSAPKQIKTSDGSSLLPRVFRDDGSSSVKLQIVTGSYEKVLHGFIASIPTNSLIKDTTSADCAERSEEIKAQEQDVGSNDLFLRTSFADTFLFTAHTAPIKALTISPPSGSSSTKGRSTAPGGQNSKRILATAAPDEKINLYVLSAMLPKGTSSEAVAKPNNKHLGALHEHTNTPTTLFFTPNRSKLITTGEDSRILIFRTRDWSLLSNMKVPKPKTAGSNVGLLGGGERPGGVMDLALHPSQKILLSVSKRERCLRMWNMMTGRKAGVLGFTKEVMGPLGKRIGGADGEGNKIRWSPKGDEFAVAFERGVIVFGMDSRPKLRILPNPISKVHQIHYLTPEQNSAAGILPDRIGGNTLAVSTEDGRILFYCTTLPPRPPSPLSNEVTKDNEDSSKNGEEREHPNINKPVLLGHIGGRDIGMVDRIKDFTILEAPIPSSAAHGAWGEHKENVVFVVTVGSSGTVRIWHIGSGAGRNESALEAEASQANKKQKLDDDSVQKEVTESLGTLVGIYETGRRITCLGGMVMTEGDDSKEGDDVKEESDCDSSSEEDEGEDEE